MNDLSIIIPCYNEAGNISALIKKLNKIDEIGVEIILVNNGSTDDTLDIINKLIKSNNNHYKVLDIKNNIGYGHGIISGLKVATGEIIAWTHADLQTDPIDVVDAYKLYYNELISNNCIVKGKRKGRNFFDTFFTYAMSNIASLYLSTKLNDINAQPKMFHKSFLLLLNKAPNDFSLDLYLLFLARKNQYKIIEFPVFFSKRLSGNSKGGGTFYGKIKLIRRTWKYIINLRKKGID